MRLNDINGCYTPSFFNMILETEEDTSVAVNKYSATFAHEFIHYIQDIILPYNIRANLIKLNWFSNIRQSALKNGCIVCPFDDWYSDSRTTIMQCNMTMGINKDNSGFVDKVWKMEDAIPTFESASGFDASYSMKQRKFDVYTYNMRINDIISYNLGARDLLEYIAHKIEAKHFVSNDRLPQLPYESVDLLFDHYGLSNVTDDIRLCIAEACLYNDNPMRFLFNIFLDSNESKNKIATLSYEEIYDNLLSIEFHAKDGVRETINHKTNRRLIQFENTLSLQYANFTGIKNWIGKVNQFAERELLHRFIFSDLYKMDTVSFQNNISWIISCIGLPMVMNSREECISLQSDTDNVEEFVQFYILQKFLEYVTAAQQRKNICPIYNFCKANGEICDEKCNCDLQLEQLEHKNCPYFKFLKSYGLLNISIK